MKIAVHYVGYSCHHMMKSRILAYTQADEVVHKEVARSAVVPLKPWVVAPVLIGVP